MPLMVFEFKSDKNGFLLFPTNVHRIEMLLMHNLTDFDDFVFSSSHCIDPESRCTSCQLCILPPI